MTLTKEQVQALAQDIKASGVYEDSGVYVIGFRKGRGVRTSDVEDLARAYLESQQRLAELEGLVTRALPHQYDTGYRSGATAECHHCWGCGARQHVSYDDAGATYRTEVCGDTCVWRQLKEAIAHA